MTKRRTLVTGATGLVGFRVAKLLAERGHSVRVLARDVEKAKRLFPGDVEIVRGDVTRPETLGPAVDGIDWVFHAAGMPEQWQADDTVFDRVNRQGTRNVLEASAAAGVKRVIYTSTMDVFATDAEGRLDETRIDPDPKHSAYERSKQAAEREAEAVRAKGLEVVYVNPAAVYGPSPVHVSLNTMFIELLNRRAPMLPPGGVSVVYVDGVAEAHLAAAERGKSGERYLLADEHLSIAALAREVCRQGGLRKAPPSGPAWALKALAGVSAPLARALKFRPLIAPGQLQFLLWNARVDASKARRELGFEPMPFERGARLTIESLRNDGVVPRA